MHQCQVVSLNKRHAAVLFPDPLKPHGSLDRRVSR